MKKQVSPIFKWRTAYATARIGYPRIWCVRMGNSKLLAQRLEYHCITVEMASCYGPAACDDRTSTQNPTLTFYASRALELANMHEEYEKQEYCG